MSDRLRNGLQELMRQKRRERGASYSDEGESAPTLSISIGMHKAEPPDEDEEEPLPLKR